MKYIYLIVSGATLCLFIYCVFGEVRFWSTAQEASGTVVGLDARHDSDDGTLYYPVVRFVTSQGQAVTDTSRSGSSSANYAVGEAVRVRYNPAKLTQMELPDFMSRWGTILLSGVFALFFCWPWVSYLRGLGKGSTSPTAARLKEPKSKQARPKPNPKPLSARLAKQLPRIGSRLDTTQNPTGSSAGRPQRKSFVHYFILTVGISLLLTMFGAPPFFFVYSVFKAVRSWQQDPTGKVVGLDARNENGNNDSTYYPIIRFVTPQGQAVTDTLGYGSSPASYAVGEAVRVRYDPANPTQITVPDFLSRWVTSLISGLFVLFFLVPLARRSKGQTSTKSVLTRLERHSTRRWRRRGFHEDD